MKILMRAAMNHLENPSTQEVIMNNMIGGNAGNMLFTYSIMRTLMLEDTQIDTTLTLKEFSDEQAAEINEKYDCFVIPLANAFRKTFVAELKVLTNLVRRLTIPCIVIGVGVQTKIEDDINGSFSFDEASKNFVKQVLKKSSIIGVRGEITANYLKKLGFVEDKDFTVIGCPSMYMFGDKLEVKEKKELTEYSPVCVNKKINIPGKYHDFLTQTANRFKDCVYISQVIDDFYLLYLGKPIDRNKYRKIHKTYPYDLSSKIITQGKETGFTNVPSWLDFLRSRDFSFGTRIHGSVAAVVAGTPAFIFAPDSRILELADYHNLRYMLAKDITDDTDIFDIYEKTDFSIVKKGHKERFEHYLDFLRMNGLETIYDYPEKECKFDRLISQMDFDGAISLITNASQKELMERIQCINKLNIDEKTTLLKRVKFYQNKNSELQAELDEIQKSSQNSSGFLSKLLRHIN